MAFNKEVTSAPAWDFEENPVVEGEYLGSQSNVGENNSMLYKLKQANGDIVAVWGSTVLDNKMSNVGEGQLIQIKYLGKVKSEKRKGSSYKDFAVFIDDGNPL